MFQIIFNELSAAEISALPKKLQLELLAQFQILPEDLDQLDSRRFGVIERAGKKLYRYRAKDYRIYFAKTDEGIKVYRVLHKNTFLDFLFRSKLPVSEDAQLGETREFWKLIEQGEKTRKANQERRSKSLTSIAGVAAFVSNAEPDNQAKQALGTSASTSISSTAPSGCA